MNHHVLLAYFSKLTPARYRLLLGHFKTASLVWKAEFSDLAGIGLDESIADEFVRWKETVDEKKIAADLEREAITAVGLDDPRYPRLLKQIYDPPVALFVRGSVEALSLSPALGVVGTRRMSAYGQQAAIMLVAGLARHGVNIVSGLAYGIDSVAHEAALEHQGVTVAVLGGGVDSRHIKPVDHVALARRIMANGGAIVAEYPPGTMPNQFTYPARNRIIAGLTAGTLVIEAPTESGALITARAALDQNRSVFAVPHPITSPSGAGGNELLKRGAVVVTGVDDILNELNIPRLPLPLPNADGRSETEIGIMEMISLEPRHIDDIIKDTQLGSAAVMSSLAMLELAGAVRQLPGGRYVRATAS